MIRRVQLLTVFLTVASSGRLYAIEPESVVLPDVNVFGTRVGQTSPLLVPDDKDDKWEYPESISLDLDGPVIYGLMATYSEGVDFRTLVAAVNVHHKKWSRDPDGEMAAWGVTVWRNEDARVAIQVSGSTILMIWLDRAKCSHTE